ncbi:MAG: Bacterial pullanase-associated domain, partial [Bacillota bacterium]
MKKYIFIYFIFLLSSCFNPSNSTSISDSSFVFNSNINSNNNFEISNITFRFRGDNISNYANHALWIWEDGFDGELFIFENADAYGGYISLPITTWQTTTKLNYIVRPANTWAGQSPDTTIFFA